MGKYLYLKGKSTSKIFLGSTLFFWRQISTCFAHWLQPLGSLQCRRWKGWGLEKEATTTTTTALEGPNFKTFVAEMSGLYYKFLMENVLSILGVLLEKKCSGFWMYSYLYIWVFWNVELAQLRCSLGTGLDDFVGFMWRLASSNMGIRGTHVSFIFRGYFTHFFRA